MVTLDIDLDEDVFQKLEQIPEISLSTLIQEAIDATHYGWSEYAKIYPEVRELLSRRCILTDLRNRIDDQIDDFIENIEPEKK